VGSVDIVVTDPFADPSSISSTGVIVEFSESISIAVTLDGIMSSTDSMVACEDGFEGLLLFTLCSA
jgi:hypothetical protein